MVRRRLAGSTGASGAFPSRTHDTGAQGRRHPETGIAFQPIQRWSDKRKQAIGLGLQQYAQNTDGTQAQLKRYFVAAPFVHENGVSMDLDGQGQCCDFAGVKSGGGTNDVGNN